MLGLNGKDQQVADKSIKPWQIITWWSCDWDVLHPVWEFPNHTSYT